MAMTISPPQTAGRPRTTTQDGQQLVDHGARQRGQQRIIPRITGDRRLDVDGLEAVGMDPGGINLGIKILQLVDIGV